MNRRTLYGGAALVTAAILGGCASADEKGTVTVDIRAGSTADYRGPRDVVVLDTNGDRIATGAVDEASTLTFEGIPLGRVTVQLGSVCEGEGELTSAVPSLGLIVDGTRCEIVD